MKRETRAPIVVAAVLLLLPALYVGSYFALVVPGGIEVAYPSNNPHEQHLIRVENYRIADAKMRTVFWPLEQVDRKIRPGPWQSSALEQMKQLESQIKVRP